MTIQKSTERKLSIELPRVNVEALFSKKVSEYQKKAQIDGFRSGKVPKAIILKRFGDSIRQEALNESIDALVRDELLAEKIDPVGQPVLDNLKDEASSDVISFDITAEIDPAFELTGYNNLGIKAEEVELDEAKLEEELVVLQKRFAENEPLETAAKEGDVVSGEYLALKIEDEDKELPENPKFKVELGASGTPGFDAQLEGVKTAEVKDIEFTFPYDYHSEELQGKKANYNLRVDEVAEVKLPELNDEFAAKLGMADIAELKEKIQESILEGLKANALKEAQDKAIEIVLEKNVFDVPESRIQHYVASSLKKEEGQGVTTEELEAGREEAIGAIRKFRILNAIAIKENLKAKQADVDARIQEMANYYGAPFDQLKEDLRKSGRVVQLREELKLDKALKFIVGVTDEELIEA
jgi:trigger factor